MFVWQFCCNDADTYCFNIVVHEVDVYCQYWYGVTQKAKYKE